MPAWLITALGLAALAIAYQCGLSRSRQVALAEGVRLHSRPHYHGIVVALWAAVPLLLVLLGWLILDGAIKERLLLPFLPPDVIAGGDNAVDAALGRIRAIASGEGVADTAPSYEIAAAERLGRIEFILGAGAFALAALLAAGGAIMARRRIRPQDRARNRIERIVRGLLLACSVIAILTTIGIVLSLIVETLHFFQHVHPLDFFFGTEWNPRYSVTGSDAAGSYGLLPLIWGTLMIAGIAMLVAVPFGLMTAIWLTQYARPRLRSLVKPVIEMLAGIPTIVYGFFALAIVGPLLARTGATLGLEVNATSALTAGLVMGVMIIPFISSLSDDIIRQVPRAMRDGSLGLGATRSETIRRVILPAALPGIVGAILLAVSRAIGETMIVLLAAGNSPVLRFDPTEPASTVTVTIVAQMFGDSDFAAPQSLVAFALGLTLFIITLLLNIVALQVVRRYREQYE